MKVVIHISNLSGWGLAIANARNLRIAEPDCVIEIYANAGGVENYFNLEKRHHDTLKEISETGTKLFACRNTMKARNLEESNLPDFVHPVNSAIRELVEKQNLGFAYIKP